MCPGRALEGAARCANLCKTRHTVQRFVGTNREAYRGTMNIHIHQFQPGGAVADEAALEQFQKQWTTYQKLVDTDALSHKEVGKMLHDTLKAIAKPFAFLDIACGDAGQMKRALAGTKVSHYHGVDLQSPRSNWRRRTLRAFPSRSSSIIATSSRL